MGERTKEYHVFVMFYKKKEVLIWLRGTFYILLSSVTFYYYVATERLSY